MSFQALTWAVQQDISPAGKKLTLLILANAADDIGKCWPSQKRIAEQTGLSVRSVRGYLRTLEEEGILGREERRGADGQRASDVIYLDIEGDNRQQAAASAPTSGSVASPNRQQAAAISRTVKKRKTTPPMVPPKNQPIQEAYDLYNMVAEDMGLPIARTLSPERVRHLRARLKEHGLGGWKNALLKIGKSPHLLGNNDRGWRADLDFLLRPAKLNKVIEGSYIDKENGR